MKQLILSTLALAISAGASAQEAPESAASPAPGRSSETERVVVTAGAIEHSETDTIEPVAILNQENLKRDAAATLGDTLRDQPGVAASGFTAGASRPVIRGLADNRVRVLNNGTEVFDVSNLSPDHAPSVSPLLSSSIEVVRGPATILYGSGAIGGVVNVNDTRIPVEAPSSTLSGEIAGRFGSVDLERSGAISLQLAPAKHFVLHGDASIFRTDDRGIPGFALSDRIRDELTPEEAAGRGFGENPKGKAPNTYVRTKEFGVGGSYVWEKGYVGASLSEFRSIYGIPADPEAPPGEEQSPVHLDVTKRQANLRSSIVDPVRGIHNANLKLVYTDYEHQEIDGGEVAATFKTNGIDSRLEIVHEPIGKLQGSFGGQALFKKLSILGPEAFLQPTETLQLAAFLFEEVKLNAVRFQAGVRVEHDTVEIDSDDPELTSLTSSGQKSRDFLPISAAGGMIYELGKDYTFAANLTFSQRAPTAEELFARGPHEATFQFIVGSPGLEVETSRGIDVSLRKTAGVITGSVSGFYNQFSDFIAFTPTAEFEDGLRVFDYTAKNAEFFGGEAQVQFHLLPLTLRSEADSAVVADAKSVRSRITGEATEPSKNPNDLFLDLRADYVQAEETATGEPLPRITPFRYSASLNYRSEKWEARIEGQRVSRQNRTADFETSTPGYTFLNASAGYNFRAGPGFVNVYVRGTNLLNEEAREHLSFLKDALPLAGRSVLIGARITF
ncbi:MAG: TonB-dependent receptor [Chthoniobacterales bacterium]|nr:TonB-dependent receptor [Chthoniobacterales bacterium]